VFEIVGGSLGKVHRGYKAMGIAVFNFTWESNGA
jgi:hypothetical protein